MQRPASYRDHPLSNEYAERLSTAFGITLTQEPLETWRDFRGHRVHLDDWRPTRESRGTVVLVHGAGGHGRLLAPFALPLVTAGYRVLAPDLPGYGLTVTDRSKPLCFDDWVDLITELVDEAVALGPTALFGLSLGGITSVFAAQRARRVDAVVTSTLIDMRDPATLRGAARTPWLGTLSHLGFRLGGLLDSLALPLAWVSPIERLTTDRALAALLVRDPLIGKNRVPMALFRSMHQYKPTHESWSLPCPLLLVHPGADSWTPTAMSMPVFDAIQSEKTLVELTNGAHAPLESPAYDELVRALEDFLGKHLRKHDPKKSEQSLPLSQA